MSRMPAAVASSPFGLMLFEEDEGYDWAHCTYTF